ncbi:helix-turn-helix domain-containing protein [Natribaculum luteum]|uniref:Helix-turn-helix domain-containing protein n=1 Tax=Natribaculum luteum TaxID=1586232 RepID=A0ABD5NWE4_9EURY|nr:helix-turn-helix domain-containing protein [Natribaculum luteum]
MPRAKLSITVPRETWIHDVSTTYPDAVFRVVTLLAGERTGIGLVEVRTDESLPVITAIDRSEDVVELDLLWKHDETALLQLETTSPPLLLPVWQASVPIEMPFEIRDGTATWQLTTSSARLSDLGTRLEDAGISYDIEYVHELGTNQADRILTDRQRELLLAAVDGGYYATPRETTLTGVADDLGISKATCSDVLHRAEGSIISWFVDEYLLNVS